MASDIEDTRLTRPRSRHLQPETESASIRVLKQDRSMETRERLVNAAIQVLSDLGYAGFSTLRVARLAGVSRGALQYHFESREALFCAARLRLAEAMKEKLAPGTLSVMSLEDRVRAMVSNYWDVIGSNAYVAALEIRLYERFNQDLHDSMSREMRDISEVRDRSWIRIFSDSPLPTEDLVLLRRLMLDVLRGVALRKLEGDPPATLTSSVELLIDMLVTKLRGK
ncbi:TetR/AcrR family transcriptional regulator [Rhodoligotrophos ferricapiens]|uniref:TetR/AcrR family transcriptional regulator n=1 Tax=Rhodoligotrophos ferricapiens TaxID=3069264 RepID=UPI00315CF471